MLILISWLLKKSADLDEQFSKNINIQVKQDKVEVQKLQSRHQQVFNFYTVNDTGVITVR